MSVYLSLLPMFLLLVTSLVMLAVRVTRPGFAYFWLIAALGALLSWPLVFLLRWRIPQDLPLAVWKPEQFFSTSPALRIDALSWPFAWVLASLVLAVILTDVARAAEVDWSAWAGALALASMGIFAVLAGNPLTLLLAWAAIDLVELLILLNHVEQSQERERVIISFSARVAGILLLLWGGIVARMSVAELTFDQIPPSASVSLLLASGFRLGIIPLNLPLLHEVHLRRGLGTLVRLAPAASSLVLLARTAQFGVPVAATGPLLTISGLAAVYAGFRWMVAKDELDGRPFWMFGLASLALASAVRGQAGASLAWGVAMLLSGGLLFLMSARHRYLLILLLAGFAALTAFPFTPTWVGGLLFTSPWTPRSALFLVALALLLTGYLRHSLRPGPGLSGAERWVYAIYPVGLLLLPLTHYLIGWLGFEEAGPLSMARFFPGLISLVLMALGIFIWQRTPEVSSNARVFLTNLLSLGWFYRMLWNLYRGVSRFFAFISTVLEGEGGILWALLFLTLLIAFIVQGRLGK